MERKKLFNHVRIESEYNRSIKDSLFMNHGIFSRFPLTVILKISDHGNDSIHVENNGEKRFYI